jgi:hypothetical protein
MRWVIFEGSSEAGPPAQTVNALLGGTDAAGEGSVDGRAITGTLPVWRKASTVAAVAAIATTEADGDAGGFTVTFAGSTVCAGVSMSAASAGGRVRAAGVPPVGMAVALAGG